MTDHNDAIERALERLKGRPTPAGKVVDNAAILRDLVAEVGRDFDRMGILVPHDYPARLARIVERAERETKRNEADCLSDPWEALFDILAIAREGGSDEVQ